MFGLQAPELILILILVLVIFGAGKLPQVFGSLGKGVKEFRNASEGNDTQPPSGTAATTTTSTSTLPSVPPTPNTIPPVATQQDVKRTDS